MLLFPNSDLGYFRKTCKFIFIYRKVLVIRQMILMMLMLYTGLSAGSCCTAMCSLKVFSVAQPHSSHCADVSESHLCSNAQYFVL